MHAYTYVHTRTRSHVHALTKLKRTYVNGHRAAMRRRTTQSARPETHRQTHRQIQGKVDRSEQTQKRVMNLRPQIGGKHVLLALPPFPCPLPPSSTSQTHQHPALHTRTHVCTASRKDRCRAGPMATLAPQLTGNTSTQYQRRAPASTGGP